MSNGSPDAWKLMVESSRVESVRSMDYFEGGGQLDFGDEFL